MITDVAAFLKWYEGVNRRAVRDISALPQEAETWRPPAGEGEASWDIRQLVEHIVTSRHFFARAFVEGSWVYEDWGGALNDKASWIEALNKSASDLKDQLAGTPPEWLTRRVTMVDQPGSVSGWRVLMMMAEHKIHHRSQIDTYAGMNGWPVEQIYGRRYEEVAGQPAALLAMKRRREGR